VTVLKSRAVLIGLPDFFSTFPLKKKQILYLVGVKLAIFIYICVVEYKNKKIIRLEDFET
jgi:hypothetical protein